MTLSPLELAGGVAFSLAFFGQAGYLALRVVTARGGSLGVGETLSLSWGLGVGLVTLEMLGLGVAGVRFSLAALLAPWVLAWSALVAARLAGRLPATSDPSRREEPARTSIACAVVLAALVTLLGLLVLRCAFHPVDLWDAIAIWDLKARAFFFDRGVVPFVNDRFYAWAHLEYPQLLPLAGTLLYLCLGQPHPVVQLIPLAFFVALLGQFHGALRREAVGRAAALALTGGLALAPNLLYWSSGFQAESALAYYAFTTAAFFYLYLRGGRRSFLVVSALAGAFLTQTKIEGAFFLVPALAVLAVTALAAAARKRADERRRRHDLLLYAGIIAVVCAPWLVYRRLVSPYEGLLSGSVASAAIERLGNLPRVLAAVLAWVSTPDMGAPGLVFVVVALLVAVEWRTRLASLPQRYLFAFLGFGLIPYLLLMIRVPEAMQSSGSRYLLVCTVAAYWIAALWLGGAGSSEPPSGRQLFLAAAATGVALLLSQSAVLSRGLAAESMRWTFPKSATAWRLADNTVPGTAGDYVRANTAGDGSYLETTGELRLDTVANRSISLVAKGSAATSSWLVVHWRGKDGDGFRPQSSAAVKVDWTGADQRIALAPGWLGTLGGLRIAFRGASAQGQPLIRSIETGPRLPSTLAAIVEGGGATILGVFALALLLVLGASGRAAPTPSLVACVWAVCVALTWLLPDLWLGSPPGFYRRPLSLAAEIWKQAALYPGSSPARAFALVEDKHGRRSFGEAFAAQVETCPPGNVALFVEPADTDSRDPVSQAAASETSYALLRAAHWLYPAKPLVVTQPARLARLLRSGAVTRVLAFRRTLPGRLLQPPARVVNAGGAWIAACGPSRAQPPHVAARFNRPPPRTLPGGFRPSDRSWAILEGGPPGTRATRDFAFGAVGDLAVAGDWDGDGVDTVGVYRRAEAVFELRNSNAAGAPDLRIAFGRPGDLPIAGDWDGDGSDEVGVFRPAEGVFELQVRAPGATGGTALRRVRFGADDELPLAGDWNGDGVDDLAVYHPASATFLLRRGADDGNAEVTAVRFGIPGDLPVAGDWDGDGIDTIGVYRPSQQAWFMSVANEPVPRSLRSVPFGRAGQQPVAGAWLGSPWWTLD